MTNASQTWQRTILLTAALAVVLYGLFSALDAPRYTYTGYSRRGSRIVTVEGGSPAAAAGLRPGDALDSVNGIPLRRIEDLEHRLTTGEVWRLAVRRNGTVLTPTLTPTGQPPIEIVRARSRSILGLCLVVFTIWAFLTSPGAATMLLAVAGLTFGFMAPWAPYVPPGIVRRAGDATTVLAFTIGMVAVVHFILVFPSRARFLERPWALWLLYAPAAAMAIPSAGNVFLPPSLRLDPRLLGTLSAVVILAYCVWAIVQLVRRYVATPRAERSKHGLGLILGSTLAAVLPFLFFTVAPSLWPAMVRAHDAYSPYAAATFSIVPLAFSVAAVRSARSTKTSGDTGH